ncbi:Uncharacterized protein F10E9.4 [Toxocara canis]|uniref:Uncharacterized protein F10E9.4 n=1 Tax=Toxocara canis TaxID=6265 RepID=A0A0B2UW08_TOXCA|nr:Uncharacterized protein F10E9.4 [Toxocara canis]
MRVKYAEDGTIIKELNENEPHNTGSGRGDRCCPPPKKRIKRERLEDDIRVSLMTYKDAKRLMREDESVGLKEVYDRRHITIGWHQCGRVLEAIKSIFSKSLGRYRYQLKAVPLAIGKIKMPPIARIIADQPCMHIDVCVRTIIFRPVVGYPYKCIVTSVGKRFVTAKIFDMITFVAPLKKAMEIPEVGDEVLIRYQNVDIKESICQMKGALTKSRTRIVKWRSEEDEEVVSE